MALESLDSMRCANLEVEFMTACASMLLRASSLMRVDHARCTYCEREPSLPLPPVVVDDGRVGGGGGGGGIGRARLEGSRIRCFGSGERHFFSKSSAQADVPASSSCGGGGGRTGAAAARSCPSSLSAISGTKACRMEHTWGEEEKEEG